MRDVLVHGSRSRIFTVVCFAVFGRFHLREYAIFESLDDGDVINIKVWISRGFCDGMCDASY